MWFRWFVCFVWFACFFVHRTVCMALREAGGGRGPEANFVVEEEGLNAS